VPAFIYDNNFKNSTYEDLNKNYTKRFKYICSSCKKTFKLEEDYYHKNCPYCKKPIQDFIMKEYKQHFANEFSTKYSYSYYIHGKTSNCNNRFYILMQHPDDKDGILIYKILRKISGEKNTITDEIKIEYSLEHIVGKEMQTYKHLKTCKKECDPFDMFNINTKNLNNPPEIIYSGYNSFDEWAEKNEKFLKLSGFQAVLKYAPYRLNLEPFFIIFIGVVNKYPIIEQIIKMGQAKLFFNLYNAMWNSMNKDEINFHIEQMSNLVNIGATKGKEALRIPPYIGDYLLKKNAKIEEYYYWRDIYELTNITKEQFENFTESFNYAWINSQANLEDISNILKFDYKLEKLFNYIVKQSRLKGLSIKRTVDLLSDYLNMCDFVGVEPDKFPSDLKKIHDDMIGHMRAKQEEANTKLLYNIGVSCERYVIPDETELDNIGIPKLFKEYTVVFPKTYNDFIDEGNQQHNCVGSYPKKVLNGDCIVFFIRPKNNPSSSFITAEYKRGELGQCFLSNNRFVSDENILKFASYIANKIKAGISSGKIEHTAC
jgi:hypothetical protein